MTPEHLALLCKEESTRWFVYDDATGSRIIPGYTVIGHPTIGTGRALDTHGITSAENIFLLTNDITYIEGVLQRYEWWVNLDLTRRDVITDMAFNMGIEHLLNFHHMIEALSNGLFDDAADEMLNSTWANQVPARAAKLVSIMRAGVL